MIIAIIIVLILLFGAYQLGNSNGQSEGFAAGRRSVAPVAPKVTAPAPVVPAAPAKKVVVTKAPVAKVAKTRGRKASK
jgi:hypothetical protein